MKQISLASLIFGFIFTLTEVHSEESLDIGLLIASKGQRNIYYQVAKQFEEEHPGIKVNFIVSDDKSYKSTLEQRLKAIAGPDILYWQAGERLYQVARQGLIEPIDTLWNQEGWGNSFTPGVKNAVTFEGRVYGLPYSYYQWGFYYKKSLFQKLKLEPPQTWDDFLRVCESLKSVGVHPIIIGTKNHWPAAGWFDYLNLRMNGLEFHQQLMRGKVSYTDAKVREVFKTWKNLIDQDYFVKEPERRDWKEELPYLYRDMAGMILSGNFVEQHFSEEVIDDIGFFKFPQMIKNMPRYEEAPMEIFMIPKNGTNRESAKSFLTFIGRPDIQSRLNQGLGYIPPNIQSKPGDSYFIQEGFKLLNEAQGLSQFYDRDTSKEMASKGIKLISKFMQYPDVDKVTRELEEVRAQVF